MAPPPPPPPPPLDENGSSPMQQQAPHQIMPKLLPNGDIQSNGMMGGPKQQPKKILPPFHDTRSDLMKAIRDGKIKLIKKKELFKIFFSLNFRHNTT